MKIFLSHSPSDSSHCRILKRSLLESGHSVIDRSHPLELYSMLTTKGKQRISQCDVSIVILTANALASYRVHQEVEYMKEIEKDYFVVENFASKIEVRRHLFPSTGTASDHEDWKDELEQINLILLAFTDQYEFREDSIVYHVSKV